MLGRERRGGRVSSPPPLQLVQQIGGLRERSLMFKYIRNCKARGREQSAGHGEIEHDRNQRRMRQRARECLARCHGLAVFFGSIRASIWKRLPGSEAEGVVGA